MHYAMRILLCPLLLVSGMHYAMKILLCPLLLVSGMHYAMRILLYPLLLVVNIDDASSVKSTDGVKKCSELRWTKHRR
jgi:hypothetical protein